MTRCEKPAGWTEVCHVTIAIDSTRDSSSVTAQFDNGDQFVLERHAGAIAIRYFEPISRDSSWASRWETSATLPMAIGLITGRDTLVFSVGPSRE
ncbi:MAG: hypothetical protein JWM41_4989 [Gemmatimonadetes bacterium]|nr:hypothetical protein [Gemmatimonadota bacterium]